MDRKGKNMFLHGNSAEGDGEDAGHVEDLRREVGEVGHDEHEQWLQNRGVVGKPTKPK